MSGIEQANVGSVISGIIFIPFICCWIIMWAQVVMVRFYEQNVKEAFEQVHEVDEPTFIEPSLSFIFTDGVISQETFSVTDRSSMEAGQFDRCIV
jgi:hypothetical protein